VSSKVSDSPLYISFHRSLSHRSLFVYTGLSLHCCPRLMSELRCHQKSVTLLYISFSIGLFLIGLFLYTQVFLYIVARGNERDEVSSKVSDSPLYISFHRSLFHRSLFVYTGLSLYCCPRLMSELRYARKSVALFHKNVLPWMSIHNINRSLL